MREHFCCLCGGLLQTPIQDHVCIPPAPPQPDYAAWSHGALVQEVGRLRAENETLAGDYARLGALYDDATTEAEEKDMDFKNQSLQLSMMDTAIRDLTKFVDQLRAENMQIRLGA